MKNNFLPFMLGVAWTLSLVYIALNWDEITHSGWQVPKVGVVIFGLTSIGGLFSYLTLLVATQYDTPTTTHGGGKTKQTSEQEDNLSETEELVELRPFSQLKTIYKNDTL